MRDVEGDKLHFWDEYGGFNWILCFICEISTLGRLLGYILTLLCLIYSSCRSLCIFWEGCEGEM